MSNVEGIKRRLFEKLKQFNPQKDFVVGVMSNAKHTEDQETILKFLEEGKDIDPTDVILLSLHLTDLRNDVQ